MRRRACPSVRRQRWAPILKPFLRRRASAPMSVPGFASGASSDVKARLVRWLVFIAVFVWLGRAIGLVRFWIFGLIFLATAAYASATVDPTLYSERLRPAGPTIDRDALRAIRLLAGAEIAIALLDIGRFHWSDTVPSG